MTVSETPTPEQVAAGERAMDGLEAQADIWADEINLVLIIKNIGAASRGLTDRMPVEVREGFINRQEANIDALVRQAYLEGFDRGGESRKAYDEARLTAALSDQVVVPKEPTPEMIEAAEDFHANGIWYADGASTFGGIYKAMIDAAPPPSSTAGER